MPRPSLRLVHASAVLIGLSLLCSTAAARREGGPSTGAIMLNPLGLFYGPLMAELDFGLGAQGSLNLRGSRWNALSSAPSGTSAWAIGLGAQVFASGPIYDGVFAYPALDVLFADAPSGGSPVTAFMPQVLFGYEFDWKFLALRLGLGAFALVPKDQKAENALGNGDVGLLIDISGGVTF